MNDSEDASTSVWCIFYESGQRRPQFLAQTLCSCEPISPAALPWFYCFALIGLPTRDDMHEFDIHAQAEASSGESAPLTEEQLGLALHSIKV